MELKDRKRVNRIFLVFVLLFTAVLGKAFKVQVLDRDKLISKSKRQFFRQRIVYPKRGNIYDRNGSPLAINIQTYSIFTIPKNLKGKTKPYKTLSKIAPSLTYSKIKKRVNKRKKFTWISRKIELTKEQVSAIKKLDGIYVEAVPKRIYPNHELLSQTLGFVGIDNAGLSGIEYAFDKELKGEPTIIKYVRDNKGRPVRFTSGKIGGVSKDVYLSVDKDLQSIAEKALKDAVVEYEAVRGGVGVMDAETGEILAIANYPSFDPNEVKNSKSIDRKLSFISDPFEPGSTFKLMTVASALENKIARPDTNFYCEHGRLKVEGHIIKEAEAQKKYEWLSVDEIVKYSSNVGTTKIAFDLTFPKLKSTIEDFGFGVKTGVEIPGESRGIFTTDENVSPLSLSNISFGQGVATTGIQMLSAYAAIANGGEYIKPTIIKGGNKEADRTRIMSKKTADELTSMMVNAVEDGTGGRAKIPYFTIAGKTSTAQRADKFGRYSGYIPGFIGYPVGVNQKFVIYVYVDKPIKGKAYYGNVVAAPVFKKIAQHMLYKNKDLSKMAIRTDAKDSASFDAVKVRHSSTRVLGRTNVPNFIGLDKRSSNKLGNRLKVDLSHRGIGVVKSQSPAPGVKITKDTIVKLIYEPPTYE
jgi:cell division protein FtsI (penicillin-binding protein 3)